MNKGLRAFIAAAVALGCSDDNAMGPDWRKTENPCSDFFAQTPEVVEALLDEIDAEGYTETDVKRLADLNRQNAIFIDAREVDCMAWLVKNPQR